MRSLSYNSAQDDESHENKPASHGPRPSGLLSDAFSKSEFGHYLVLFVEEEDSETETLSNSREALFQSLSRRSSDLRDRLLEWINSRGLSGEVAFAGEPTAMQTIDIVCSQAVADSIREAPIVESVIEESNNRQNLSF